MQVKFITAGSNSAFGSFEAGSTLRCSPEMARHLVEDVKCAKYMEAPTVPAIEPAAVEPEPEATAVAPEPEAPKRGRKHKAKEQE